MAATPSGAGTRTHWLTVIPEPILLSIAATASMLCYIYSWSTGSTLGTVLFFAIWLFPIVIRPAIAAELLRYPVAWLLPALAMASTAWSRAPDVTAKAAAEYIVFNATVILMARILPVRMFLIGLTLGCGLLVIASALSGAGNLAGGSSDDFNLVGVFASKNALSLCAGVVTFAALALALDGGLMKLLRLLCLFMAGFSLIVTFMARSVDGNVSVCLACAVLLLLTPLDKVSLQARVLALSFIGVVGAALAIVVKTLPEGFMTDILLSVGKSPALSGRAYMWLRAQDYIAQHPWFGIGYSAFWLHGFADAIGMWRHGGIPGEAGYHFHNLYYEAEIELGALGMATFLFFFGIHFLRSVGRIAVSANSLNTYLLATNIYFVSRIGLEVDFLFAFNVGNLVFVATYIYAVGHPPACWLPDRGSPPPSAKSRPPRFRNEAV